MVSRSGKNAKVEMRMCITSILIARAAQIKGGNILQPCNQTVLKTPPKVHGQSTVCHNKVIDEDHHTLAMQSLELKPKPSTCRQINPDSNFNMHPSQSNQ